MSHSCRLLGITFTAVAAASAGSTACTDGATGPAPAGLIWGSGASGAFVGDTSPLVVFYKDAAGAFIGVPRPRLTWSSSNPSVVTIASESLAVAVEPGTAVLTATADGNASYTLEIPWTVVPPLHGTLVWSRQAAWGEQPGVAVMNLPGRAIRQLPDLGYPGTASGDAYLSSDGRWAAATGTRRIAPLANSTIFVVDLISGGVQTPLDPLPGHQFAAAWFPGDTLLAFLMAATTGWEVFTARLDGSDVQQRTTLGQSIPPFFDFTPEGNLVLALSGDLYEVTLAGDIVRRLTATPTRGEGHPAVNPNGSMIAYTDGERVWVMNRDGTNPRPLLPPLPVLSGRPGMTRVFEADSDSPSWSPDGQFVLLSWHIDPQQWTDSEARATVGDAFTVVGELYAIRITDGLAIRLTKSVTHDAQPVFR